MKCKPSDLVDQIVLANAQSVHALHEESINWESKHTHPSCAHSRIFCELYGEFHIAIVEKRELSQQL
jgi:hypothetical protein